MTKPISPNAYRNLRKVAKDAAAKRYHVQVRTVDGWRRVRSVQGDPYVLTKENAQAFIRSYEDTYNFNPDNWRLEELPDTEA